MEKPERLKIFRNRLNPALAANSFDEALQLVTEILNRVEDEYSGIDYGDGLSDNGRLYPPNKRWLVKSNEKIKRYRFKKHAIELGVNGSIRIDDLKGNIFLDKQGQDSRKVGEL